MITRKSAPLFHGTTVVQGMGTFFTFGLLYLGDQIQNMRRARSLGSESKTQKSFKKYTYLKLKKKKKIEITFTLMHYYYIQPYLKIRCLHKNTDS